MKTIAQILEVKGHEIITIRPKDSVLVALEVLAAYNIGALPVVEAGKLVGIFSERDYARKVILQGKASKDIAVREIMSDRVVYVTLDQTLDQCMALMTEKRFRHLPVLNTDGSVAGIISIGDLVKETISSQQFIIDELARYISS